jgi:arylsulfatase A-like enzyme
MLFMRYPGSIPANSRRKELISNVDLLPTMMDFAGASIPRNLHGRNFRPLLQGEKYTPRDAIFAEKTFHGCYDPMRCIRTQTHKYIRYFEKSTVHRIPSDIQIGGASREQGPMAREEIDALYDLREDPGEMNNLAEDPAHENLCLNSGPGSINGCRIPVILFLKARSQAPITTEAWKNSKRQGMPKRIGPRFYGFT